MRQVIPGYDLTVYEAMLHAEEHWDSDQHGPLLSDEVDEQLWLVNILGTDASKLGEFNSAPVLTCTSTNGKRSSGSTKWGEQELREMSTQASPTITAMLLRPLLPFPNAPCDHAWDMLPSPPDQPPARTTDPWSLRGDRQPPVAVAKTATPLMEAQDDDALAEAPSQDQGGEEESLPDDTEAYENALRSTPEHWAELTDEQTADVVDSKESDEASGDIDLPSRDDIVRQHGVKTRVQLTFREDGDYVSKASLGLDDLCPTNWVLKGIPGDAVQNLIEPLAGELRRRHESDVARGCARKRGGPSVRIQMTEYTQEGGEYVKQNPGASRRRTLNQSCPGATLLLVSFLLDYLFAAYFGERSRNAAELVAFYRKWTEEGVRKPDATPSLGDPGRGSHSIPKISPDTVQLDPTEMRDQVAQFLTPQNIKLLNDRLGSAKLDRLWELADGYGRTDIDGLREAEADRDTDHVLASTDDALAGVYKRLHVLIKQAAGVQPKRATPPTVELVRPDLVSVQWSRETHSGYWCLIHGDMCIVRSVHRTPEAADAAAPTLNGSGWQIVNPEGQVVAFEGPADEVSA